VQSQGLGRSSILPSLQNSEQARRACSGRLISGREAFALFLAAAEQGHAEAMHHVAWFPEFVAEPFKSPLSAAEAWTWLLRAAEAGCVQAQYDAGATLATGGDWGDGAVVRVDRTAAVGWYLRAAEADHAEAQFNLATMLMNGEGCERDVVAAKEWFRRSIAAGHPYAQELLTHLES
jgi:uncharacterized protein